MHDVRESLLDRQIAALALPCTKVRVRDVRVVDGAAKSVHVIGKGNRERMVPLPENFGQVFGFWLSDKPKEDFVFAKEPGGKPIGPHGFEATCGGSSIGQASTRRLRPTSCGTLTRPGSWSPARS
jgi:site-specific recombinase XerC